MSLERYEEIELGSIVLFEDPEEPEFLRDGRVIWITERGDADISHLNGYKSQNDTVPYDEIVAVLDRTVPVVQLPGYRGTFRILREDYVNRTE